MRYYTPVTQQSLKGCEDSSERYVPLWIHLPGGALSTRHLSALFLSSLQRYKPKECGCTPAALLRTILKPCTHTWLCWVFFPPLKISTVSFWKNLSIQFSHRIWDEAVPLGAWTEELCMQRWPPGLCTGFRPQNPCSGASWGDSWCLRHKVCSYVVSMSTYSMGSLFSKAGASILQDCSYCTTLLADADKT